MNRNEALAIAKANHEAYHKAVIDHLFGRGPEVDEAKYGYKHGWFIIDGHSFNDEDITGQPYDHTQGGWAYL